MGNFRALMMAGWLWVCCPLNSACVAVFDVRFVPFAIVHVPSCSPYVAVGLTLSCLVSKAYLTGQEAFAGVHNIAVYVNA